jgi:hypothetical protein
MPLTAQQIDEIADLYRYGNPRTAQRQVLERIGAYISTSDEGYPPASPIINHTTLVGYTGIKAAFEAAAAGDVIEIVYEPTVLPSGTIATSVPFTVLGNMVKVDYNNQLWNVSGDQGGMTVIDHYAVNVNRFYQVPGGAVSWGIEAGKKALFKNCIIQTTTYALIFQSSPVFIDADPEAEPPIEEWDGTGGAIEVVGCMIFAGVAANSGNPFVETANTNLGVLIKDCYMTGTREGISLRSGNDGARTVRILNTDVYVAAGASPGHGFTMTPAGTVDYAELTFRGCNIVGATNVLLFANSTTQAEVDVTSITSCDLRALNGYVVNKPNGGTGALVNLPLFHARARGTTGFLLNLGLAAGNDTNFVG